MKIAGQTRISRLLKNKLIRLTLVVCLSVLLVGAWLVLWPRAPEAVFDRRPESHWIHTLGRGGPWSEYEWSKVGTNAVEILLMAVERRGGAPFKPYQAVWPKLPAFLKKRLPPPVNVGSARTNAALKLAILGDPAILMRLLTNNHDPKVRAIAASVLASNGEEEVTAVLAEAAANDKDPTVRCAALDGFSVDGRDRGIAVATVQKCLRDKNPKVRITAAGILYAFDHFPRDLVDRIVPDVITALEDKEPKVRAIAADSLYTIGIPDDFRRRAALALIKALDDKDASVSNAAAKTLIRFAPVEAIGVARKWKVLE